MNYELRWQEVLHGVTANMRKPAWRHEDGTEGTT